MIRVFHNPRTDFFRVNPSDVFTITPDELVAIVDTDDLDEAYRLTNHIDKPWYENTEVQTIRKSRSTSVGDFMELNGAWYAVAPMGFDKVTEAPHASRTDDAPSATNS